MKSFEWASPSSVGEAVSLLKSAPASKDVDDDARPIAGGQDLLTTMKDYITRPARVVNLKGIRGLDRIEPDAHKGLRIGALVTLAQLEEHAEVRRHFPGLAEAAHSVATPQIRNLGTVGGNLCQRPRCWYYRLEEAVCLKKGGSECFAAKGENKYNAILGGGPSYIVHPSDLAPVLVALGGVAPIPWRAPKSEAFLAGKTLSADALAEAARLALEGAEPLAKNAYKIPLTQALVRRALAKAGGLSV